jgi:hypothetical protein
MRPHTGFVSEEMVIQEAVQGPPIAALSSSSEDEDEDEDEEEDYYDSEGTNDSDDSYDSM